MGAGESGEEGEEGPICRKATPHKLVPHPAWQSAFMQCSSQYQLRSLAWCLVSCPGGMEVQLQHQGVQGRESVVLVSTGGNYMYTSEINVILKEANLKFSV